MWLEWSGQASTHDRPAGLVRQPELAGAPCPVSLPARTVDRPLNLPRSPFPYLIAVSPDSKMIYTVNDQARQLYQIQAAHPGSVTTISLGPAGQWSPGSVAFSSSATTLYVLSGAERQTPRTVNLGLLTPRRRGHQ